jgi:hypothetical protein
MTVWEIIQAPTGRHLPGRNPGERTVSLSSLASSALLEALGDRLRSAGFNPHPRRIVYEHQPENLSAPLADDRTAWRSPDVEYRGG